MVVAMAMVVMVMMAVMVVTMVTMMAVMAMTMAPVTLGAGERRVQQSEPERRGRGNGQKSRLTNHRLLLCGPWNVSTWTGCLPSEIGRIVFGKGSGPRCSGSGSNL
jgi:hypothetical protein